MTETSVQPRQQPQFVLAVRLGKDLLAIPIHAVEEVLPALPVEPVPNCPPFVRGVVFVRGHLIPVFDAAERLGIDGHQRPPEPHIVCLRAGSRLVGVEFDEALDLVELGDVPLLSSAGIGSRQGLISGVVECDGRIFRMLDAQRLIAQDETESLERVPRTGQQEL